MRTKYLRTSKLVCGVALCAMAVNAVAPVAAAAAQSGSNDGNTTTPIKHVIVIIGENRTFDHLFATYQPVNKDETVLNLLSQSLTQNELSDFSGLCIRLVAKRDGSARCGLKPLNSNIAAMVFAMQAT